MVALSNPKNDTLVCTVCNTREGEERPIGKVIVQLNEIEVEGSRIVLCQVCHMNKINMLNQKNKKEKSTPTTWIDKLKKLGFF